MVYYNEEQISKLLDNIIEQIPDNDHRLIGLIKYIKNKKENIRQHL